jgi:tetratricopeptide (TPR) repeat protein
MMVHIALYLAGAGLALFLAWIAVAIWVMRVHDRLLFQNGDLERADGWWRRFGFLTPAVYRNVVAVGYAQFSGNTQLALERAEVLAASSRHAASINMCINAFINAGRYKRALEVAAPWMAPAPHRLPPLWPLFQVNVAEAEYNLGRWLDALARLDHMRERCAALGIARAGEAQQRAWILAHLDRAAEARNAMSEVRLGDLPGIFHAEYQFTLAKVALAGRDLPLALQAVDAGLAVARRMSSKRNGLFLRARIHTARQDPVAALKDFEEGAGMTYRGQGGDGLLAWGDLLRSLGREDEARRAFALAVERDPESESAGQARDRLCATT